MGPLKSITLLLVTFITIIFLFFYLDYFVISLIFLIFLIGSLFQVFIEFYVYKKSIEVKLKELIPKNDHHQVVFGDKLSNVRKGILYDWDGLKKSIETNGLKNPLRVKKSKEGYNIVDGHHRLRVLKELYDENKKIKVIVINKVI